MFEPIKFIPKVVIGDLITTNEIGKRLCDYLTDKKIIGLIGAKVYMNKDQIKVTLAMSTRSNMLQVNPITKISPNIKVPNPYTLSPELIDILKPFINEEPTVTLFNSKRDTRVIINLIPIKVFDVVIEKPEDGYMYKITKAIPQKGNGLLELTKVKKQSNNHNKNNRNNKQYYGNRNNNRRY